MQAAQQAKTDSRQREQQAAMLQEKLVLQRANAATAAWAWEHVSRDASSMLCHWLMAKSLLTERSVQDVKHV